MGHQKEGYPIYSGIPLFANYIESNSANFPCENWHNLRYRDFGIKLNVRAGLSSDSPMKYSTLRLVSHAGSFRQPTAATSLPEGGLLNLSNATRV